MESQSGFVLWFFVPLLLALGLSFGIHALRGRSKPARRLDSSTDDTGTLQCQKLTGVGVFISYRREDSANARLVYERLCSCFGRPGVFMDVDTIAPGDDFVTAVERVLGSCQALVAIIGRAWISQTHRLKDEKDYVRLEIAAALRRGVRVLPVLMDGSVMPPADSLPPDLAPFGQGQALPVVDGYFEEGMERLLGALERRRAAKV